MSIIKPLAFPLDIQLFAEGGSGEGGEGGQSGAGTQTTTTSEIDYSKIEEIVNKRSTNASESAIKGYLREQGLSGEELNDAVKQYKSAQIQKQKDEKEKAMNLEKENSELKASILNSKIDTTLTTKANELGVSADKVPFILKLVEREGLVKEDGSIDEEKAVSSLNTVIEAFPDFKGESKATGFKKVGGSTKVSEETEDEELKKWRKEAGLD